VSVTTEASVRPRPIPGEFLLRPEPLAAAALIALNDFWLKPRHPGVLSGKLSDVGLCFLFPVLVAAVVEWVLRLATLRIAFAPRRGVYVLSSCLAAAYFILIKAFPWGAQLHVQMLSWLFPSRSFAATADPTDLLCLPLVFVAYRFLVKTSWRGV
jgi:hypothetical protein